TIVGITRGTTRAHLARAALEAMAFSTKDVLEAMTADAKLQLHALQVDGGAAANHWLMQVQADLLGVPVARPDVVATTALGAAAQGRARCWCAAVSAAWWKPPRAARSRDRGSRSASCLATTPRTPIPSSTSRSRREWGRCATR